MSNFHFLESEFKPLWDSATRMEKLAMGDARASCFYGRRTIEQLVHWLYEHDRGLRRPYNTQLAALIEEPSFSRVVPAEIRAKLRFIRLLGNQAVHSKKVIRPFDALRVAKETWHCCFWLVGHYTRFSPQVLTGLRYDEELVQTLGEAPSSSISVEKLQELEAELQRKDDELRASREAAANYDAEIARLRAEIAEAKRRNASIPIEHDYSEAETRVYLIDALLREAGWDPEFDDGTHRTREFEVVGMPTDKGIGRADYVLWGASGAPLAVIEAKRTTKDARIGRNQAMLYADCLESMTGHRPIIFCSNGYEHWIWDDQRYPSRPIQGFLKASELELMIQRRETAADLSTATVNKEIAGRYYQEQAIRHVTETLAQGQRRALLVMATGSGKTRTVIALCDLLQRSNWALRVLFLADRVALVKQAVKAFRAHLPQTTTVNLVTEREAAASRVYVSTYPTMMGLIEDSVDGLRRFGTGHFDVIVIDEAHRSIYRKYRAIFSYFDACLIGLTATPRDEVDRDTYSLFELATGVPTYAYELEQAVEDGYLVPPKLISVPLRFPRDGIRYDDLPEDEKEQWEMTEWDEEGNVPDAVDASALNEWLFNKDTVDKVLEHLMRNGLRVEDGQKIAKTIIFAKNHRHALFIQERFDANYPNLKGAFARVIDNQEPYAQDLIDKFSESNKPPSDAPQIVISVDMMDTGIDVPEVANLVFFKVVRSKTKFWQMIGRGTRLCAGLFGARGDKKHFYVFDFCGNFEFFNEHPEGIEGSVQEPIGARIFRQRLDLLQAIRETEPTHRSLRVAEPHDEPVKALTGGLIDHLHGAVASMHLDNFIVRPKRREVEQFQNRDRWEQLSAQDYATLHGDLAELPMAAEPEDLSAKQFDLLILRIQMGQLRPDHATPGRILKVRELASQLSALSQIPGVREQMVLLEEIQTDEYWEDVTLVQLDVLRRKLRGLIQFIQKSARKILITDFEDHLGEGVEVNLPNLGAAVDRAQYKQKLLQFLQAHEDRLALKKVRYNEPLTSLDLREMERMFFESGDLGSREDFERCYGKQQHLGFFLRRLVGLDREAAKEAFGSYLDTTTFNASQIQFINQIIEYLTANGVMEPNALFEHPFTNFSADGPVSLFGAADAGKIVSILRGINGNAGAFGEVG